MNKVMNDFSADEWLVIESRFDASRNQAHESVFCLVNGYMGVRGMLEEGFSGKSQLDGTYLAGVYETSRLQYIWERPGDPKFIKKIIKSVNWVGIGIEAGGEAVDLAKGKLESYSRTLDMKRGVLSRTFVWTGESGKTTEVVFERFVSMDSKHQGAVRCAVKPLNYDGSVRLVPSLKFDASSGWVETADDGQKLALVCDTEKSGFRVAVCADIAVTSGSVQAQHLVKSSGCRALAMDFRVQQGDVVSIDKLVSLVTSRDENKDEVRAACQRQLAGYVKAGYAKLLERHIAVWDRIWEESDIFIEGDVSAQQGIRYSIFQLQQAYRSGDAYVNIGAKGLTGDVYSGQAFWDTEIYLLPFYLYSNPAAARDLVLFRYNTLNKARARAAEMGYRGAMFPMCTVDGEEHCVVWEYGQGEIHIIAAIAYGAFQYVRVSGDDAFMADYGLEIMIETARYYANRTVYNEHKQAYVINQVTGPDEYQVMVDNNCYTNTMAVWNMRTVLEQIGKVKNSFPDKWADLEAKISFKPEEAVLWEKIINGMRIPYNEKLGIFEQDDSYLSHDYVDPKSVPDEQIPLYRNWPMERIMRSTLLKQPDVLLLMYLLSEQFDEKTVRRNYNFYTPRTIHDSSLSPCIHSILATRLGYQEESLKFYASTARMDLDDCNKNTFEGLHLACMGGAWMTVVHGFAGLRMNNDLLSFTPVIPAQWTGYRFKLHYRNRTLVFSVNRQQVSAELLNGEALDVLVSGERLHLSAKEALS